MRNSLHLVCAHCHGINRLPVDKDSSQALCGKCGDHIVSKRPVALNDQSFSRFVTRNDVPVLVDFWADWCGPCKMMAPIIDQAAAKNDPKIRFAKVDTEVARETAARYGIRSIPTMIMFSQGREVARQAGAMDLGSLNNWMKQAANLN